MSRVFLTGATGFLGMEVLARLLERTSHEVLCLVRARDDAGARERLDGVPIAWKPPSTWRISPVIARAWSERRKQTVLATGPASSVSHPSGACFAHASASCEKPGMPRAAIVPIGPALTRLTRTPRGPRSRAR